MRRISSGLTLALVAALTLVPGIASQAASTRAARSPLDATGGDPEPARGSRQAGAPPARPAPEPRTFPAFEGTWVLDEQASTGRLSATPGATITFAITPTEITLTRTRKLPEQRSNPPDDTPFRHVFRMDGTETSSQTSDPYPLGRFALVADALVFITYAPARDDGFIMVTDAYSVDGQLLIARRQLVSVRGRPGYVVTMQEPSNNHPHTFIFRRAPAAAGR